MVHISDINDPLWTMSNTDNKIIISLQHPSYNSGYRKNMYKMYISKVH